MTRVWIRRRDVNLFREFVGASEVPFQVTAEEVPMDYENRDDILSGTINDDNALTRLTENFVLGSEHRQPDGTYVQVSGNSLYDNILLTPDFKNGVRANGSNGVERVELLGGGDLASRAFMTYFFLPFVPKANERDHHFLLYSDLNGWNGNGR